MKRKRSQEKKITVQCKVVRYMRVSRGISQREAAKCTISSSGTTRFHLSGTT